MANENSIRLQGHEKFALREGWLTKGLNEVENPEYDNVFLNWICCLVVYFLANRHVFLLVSVFFNTCML